MKLYFDKSSKPKYDDVIIKGVWYMINIYSLEVLFYLFSLSCYKVLNIMIYFCLYSYD